MTLHYTEPDEIPYKGYMIVKYESFVRVYGWDDEYSCFCLLMADDLNSVSDAMSYINNL